ncbi:MAG: glycosyltransferase [Halobacteriovoraceae bacterium]|nr:glycosyltransferase [Halobacteriovoraceae bacterium]
MKVSILMNCFNGEQYLKQALDSVFAQTYENWEIIFWDNQSTDGSKKILDSYPQDKIRYFYSPEFTTLYKARNLAFEKVTGDLIALLDTDDIWLPTKLEKLVPIFEQNPNAGVVYSDTIYFMGEERWLLYDTRPFYTGKCFKELIKGNFIASPSIVYRKSAVDKLDHVFDERFNMSGDWDLSLRLSLNWALECVKEPLVEYRLHESNLSKRMPEAIIKEADQVIEKYESIIPGFKEKYRSQIKELVKERDFVLATTYWSRGERKKSREVLKDYFFTKNGFIKYFLTYLSFDFIESLKRKVRSSRVRDVGTI